MTPIEYVVTHGHHETRQKVIKQLGLSAVAHSPQSSKATKKGSRRSYTLEMLEQAVTAQNKGHTLGEIARWMGCDSGTLGKAIKLRYPRLKAEAGQVI